ncbi:MAG TPA: hypothetical protein VI322_00650 [Candidatus Saccharimonadia bacterium]
MLNLIGMLTPLSVGATIVLIALLVAIELHPSWRTSRYRWWLVVLMLALLAIIGVTAAVRPR